MSTMSKVQDLFDRANPVRAMWDRLSAVPGGRTLFSKAIGLMAPYTGTIKPQVTEVREGYARVEMEERRKVRNHLGSVHAMALTNLGEITSGLAVLYGLPSDVRGIVTAFEIDYEKKARGRLVAESDAVLPPLTEEREVAVPYTIRDSDDDVVARGESTWLLDPQSSQP
ncbi:MAG: hotdog fold domain-containing protein [Bradymonadaceae bacterium]